MSEEQKNEQIKLYAVIGLSIVAAGMAYFRFVHKAKTVTPPAESQLVMESLVIPDLPKWVKESQSLSPADRKVFEKPARDIFAPLRDTPPPAPAPEPNPADVLTPEPELPVGPPELQGIVQRGGQSLAILDGKIVQQGDKVREYTVESITRQQVILKTSGKRLILSLRQ